MVAVEPAAIVDLIYEAAIDAAALDPLLDRLIAALGGSGGWFIEADAHGLSIPASRNMGDRVMQQYVDHYHAVDPWMTAAQHVAQVGVPINFDRLVPERHFRNSEVYHDLVRAEGVDVLHNLTLPLADDPAFVAIMRGDGVEPFDEPQERLLRHLAPHLARMTAIRRMVRTPAFGLHDLRLSHPLLLLDALGRVIEMNAAAQVLVGRGNLLTVDAHRRLGCRGTSGTVLADAVQRCIRRHLPASVAIADLAGIPHRLRLAPGPRDAAGRRVPAVVVTVRDMARDIPARIEAARSAFALSAGEAALVRGLLLGRSLGEQAIARHTSRETVRKQLASIFAKVDVARQADLVTAIWSLPLD